MKIKFIKILAVITTTFFASCTVESIDPALANQINTGNIDTNAAVVDYWPSVVNNTWTYNQNGTPQTPMKIISSEVVNGKTYYTFNNLFGQSTSAMANVTLKLRKNQGEYFIKASDFPFTAGGFTGQASGFEYLLFKDFVNVNDTWTTSFTQNFTFNNPSIPSTTSSTVVDGTMLEKNTSIVVNGVTFNNVIKFKVVQKVTLSGQVTTSTSFYWYAKGVGCVKSIISSGTQDTTSELQTYNLF